MKKLPSVQSISRNEVLQVDGKVSIFEKQSIPSIHLNVKGLEGLEVKLKDMKLKNYQHEFITEMDKILQLYDEKELKYNERFVLFVMEEVEKYILKSKSGEAKKQLVIEVCKKYFNNDPDLVELVIKLVFEKLPQVKFLKRQGLKLVRFFLKVKQNQH